jgi:hypothetical protein
MPTGKMASGVLLGLAGALLGGCLGNMSEFQSQEEFALALASEGVTALAITWGNGTVTVRIDERASAITATGVKSASGNSQEAADAGLTQITVELVAAESEPTQALLTFTAPAGLLQTHSGDVVVVLPRGLPLTVTCDNGDVAVTGNQGRTEVSVASGNVRILEHTGDAQVRSGNGVIDVHSQDGDVDVSSDNGNIEVLAQPAAGGRVRVNSNVGVVHIEVPADFGAALHLSTPPLVARVDADLTGFVVTDLVQKPYEVTATLNGGGGEIVGECEVGNVVFGPLD